jgi:hypothetical protein
MMLSREFRSYFSLLLVHFYKQAHFTIEIDGKEESLTEDGNRLRYKYQKEERLPHTDGG